MLKETPVLETRFELRDSSYLLSRLSNNFSDPRDSQTSQAERESFGEKFYLPEGFKVHPVNKELSKITDIQEALKGSSVGGAAREVITPLTDSEYDELINLLKRFGYTDDIRVAGLQGKASAMPFFNHLVLAMLSLTDSERLDETGTDELQRLRVSAEKEFEESNMQPVGELLLHTDSEGNPSPIGVCRHLSYGMFQVLGRLLVELEEKKYRY